MRSPGVGLRVGVATAAMHLVACACAAGDVDDLSAWFAAAPSPGDGQVDAAVESGGGVRRRCEADAVVPLGGSEVRLMGSAADEVGAAAVSAGRLGMAAAGTGMRAWDGGFSAGMEVQAISSGPGPPARQPFADVAADAFARLPLGAHDALTALARYDTRRWLWPHALLPGVAWIHEDGDRLWMMLGFPLTALSWRSPGGLRLAVAIGDPYHAGIEQRLSATWSASLDGDWLQRAYRRDGGRGSDLLASSDARLAASIAWNPWRWLEIDASAGRMWRRRCEVLDAASGRVEGSAGRAPATFAGLAAYVAF